MATNGSSSVEKGGQHPDMRAPPRSTPLKHRPHVSPIRTGGITPPVLNTPSFRYSNGRTPTPKTATPTPTRTPTTTSALNGRKTTGVVVAWEKSEKRDRTPIRMGTKMKVRGNGSTSNGRGGLNHGSAVHETQHSTKISCGGARIPVNSMIQKATNNTSEPTSVARQLQWRASGREDTEDVPKWTSLSTARHQQACEVRQLGAESTQAVIKRNMAILNDALELYHPWK